MEDDGRNKDNIATMSNKIMFFVDTAVLVVVIVLYAITKDQSCNLDNRDLVITYIILKSIFCVFRLSLWWLDNHVSQVGGYCQLFYLVMWVPTFSQSVKWGASLTITLEGFAVLIFYAVVFCIIMFYAAKLIARSWQNKTSKDVQVDTFRSDTLHTDRVHKI